ncbi:MAG TPA: PEP-CTERM sorting domain-containing protein [Fimbriimonadaceae bacterium]|nr:PEP-CTERM sorting domain-containing protein [Fimbriimonadaceae bacterium]
MKLVRILFGAGMAAFATAAMAQTNASGTITLLSQVGSTYNYDIKLNNLGANNSGGVIETFWFAWIPDVNFMPDNPANIVNPTGWTDTITAGGGYGIQWVNSGGGLAGGNSLDGFKFSSADSPSVLMGNYNYFGTQYPILTSYVYSSIPEQGTFKQFVVNFNPAPEPSSWLALGMLAIGAVAISRRRLASARR